MEPIVDLVTASQLEKHIEMILRRQQKYYAPYRNVGMNYLEVDFAGNTTGLKGTEQHPSWAGQLDHFIHNDTEIMC